MPFHKNGKSFQLQFRLFLGYSLPDLVFLSSLFLLSSLCRYCCRIKQKHLTSLCSISLFALSPASILPVVWRAFPEGGPTKSSTATWPHSSFLFSTPHPISLACQYRCSKIQARGYLGNWEKVSAERLGVKMRIWGRRGSVQGSETEIGCLGRRHPNQVKELSQ